MGRLAACGLLALAFAAKANLFHGPEDLKTSFAFQMQQQPEEFKTEKHVGGSQPVVNTMYGPVQGINTGHTKAFKGIPYAAPPVGDRRWKHAVAPQSWSSNLKTEKFGAACPQRCAESSSGICPEEGTDESCLFLNVWTPLESPPSGGFPVLVWIHGGAYIEGSAGSHLYSGDFIANYSRVIHVSMNYRLGALGFMSHPSVDGTEAGQMFAISDQRFAMQWVKDNIASFGGNTNKITLYGESAGAQSVALHIVTPDSAKYFDAAVMQSNPASIAWNTVAKAHAVSAKFSNLLGCGESGSGVDSCMRGKSVADLIRLQGNATAVEGTPSFKKMLNSAAGWGPIVTGSWASNGLKDDPFTLVSNGEVHDIPLIFGIVQEDARPFVFLIPTPIKYLEWKALLLDFGSNDGLLNDMYPVGIFSGDVRGTKLEQLATDYLFRCSTRKMALGAHKAGRKVYMYNFVYDMSAFPNYWTHPEICKGHACHAVELGALFHTVPPAFDFPSDVDKLSKKMQGYWTSLLSHGSSGALPGSNGAPTWPAVKSASNLNNINFNVGSLGFDQKIMDERCYNWDTINKYLLNKA